ncbi:MAG: FeoB-associated Cys-rich membrane protein [Flavobacteriaceae bacterium]|nr:FeoB-associated Cys-rich membrane protein [Formosa sp.]MDG1373930.1 FeoB-associated Cys-rich membrane protein [Flavobacteriaceae bacterium]MDG2498780.1 FeoB-associated Cys-rich membrane protein [Flavobacteriaceae bacterium]
MNETFQTVIIVSILILALAYLFRKQLWKSKKKNDDCGNGSCGC